MLRRDATRTRRRQRCRENVFFSWSQVHVHPGQTDLPVPAAVQHHVHRDRAVLLPDVRVAVPAAPAAPPGRQGAGAQGRAPALEVQGAADGRRRPRQHTGVQRDGHPRPAARAPRVHRTVGAHQPAVPGAVVVLHFRLYVPRGGLRVRRRVRDHTGRVAEEEARQLRGHGHVVRLLRRQGHPALVPAPVRALRHQKGASSGCAFAKLSSLPNNAKPLRMDCSPGEMRPDQRAEMPVHHRLDIDFFLGGT